MNKKEQTILYNKINEEAIEKSDLFGKEILIIPTKKFSKYKKYFFKCFSVISLKNNYRTNRFFKHIHATEGKNNVEMHYDYGNFGISILLGEPIHFFMDFIPFFTYKIVHFGGKPYKSKL
jgi:hypothetical protein